MEPPEIVPWSANADPAKADPAKADQGKISSGSISRIVQNTLVNICTNFGAFMKSRTIGLLCCRTIVRFCVFALIKASTVFTKKDMK